MVESSVAPPARDVLLATKLHMPASQPAQVLRPRLTAHLDEGLARGLILVCAPAGYGKTVLLADWARRSGYPVAWLSLDAGDNDPARFWRHAVAALDWARPGIGDRVAPLLGPPAPASFQGLVTALINELAAQSGDGEALLVLDDYHLIGSPQVHQSLAFLLEHRPAGMCMLLASRSDPPLPLARLRARAQLTEVRAAELRFTPAEAGELLQHAASALPEASVAALTARTEGWAAGLQLAALSLRGHDDAVAFVAAFTGSHRYVLDYLAEEVLEQQDAQLRTFLRETSVLERLSGPLCDAVTGREGSQALLEEAERAALFLIPLDEVRGWWRYHHLFAGLLRTRLREEQPGRVAQLHRNAAAWYAGCGLADDAIGHAVAAGEMLWAARIIEQHFDLVYSTRGEAATIHRWLSVLPAGLVRSRPRLLLAQALMAATSGHLEVVEPLLDAVECAPPGWADELFEPAGGVVASYLINVPALTTLHRGYLAQFHGDAEATAVFSTQALAEIKPGERLLSASAHGFLAVAEWRAQAAAPPDVSRRLRLTAQAEADARRQAAGAHFQHDHPAAASAAALAAHLATERLRLEAASTQYEQWSADTHATRDTAGRAAAELRRRGHAQPDHEPHPQTGDEPQPMAGWQRHLEAEAGAVNSADASKRQATSNTAHPRPPQRLPDIDPSSASSPEPRTGPENEPAREDRDARLHELLARAAQAAQRTAAQQTERQAKSDYAARMERGAQAQAEARQQPEAQGEIELEL